MKISMWVDPSDLWDAASDPSSCILISGWTTRLNSRQEEIELYVEIPPEGATHYAGSLLDNPVWWKYVENSTGTFKGYCWWDRSKSEWMIHGEHIPHWIKEIKK